MMKSPKGAGESKGQKAARLAEQKRMEAAQLEDTQSLLGAETMRRIRRFGQLGGASNNLPGFIGQLAAAGGAPGGVGLGSVGVGGRGLGSFSGLQIGTA